MCVFMCVCMYVCVCLRCGFVYVIENITKRTECHPFMFLCVYSCACQFVYVCMFMCVYICR